MIAQNAERRPAEHGTPLRMINTLTADQDPSPISVPPTSDTATVLDAAIVVLVDIGRDRWRRRVFFSLPPAQRAVQRAAARGVAAHMVLAELRPVRALTATGVPDGR